MRVSYLGPTGTYNEEALLVSSAGHEIELAPQATIFDAVNAVERGAVERGFVPFENSIEGSVRSTLDAIAFDTSEVRIAGEQIDKELRRINVRVNSVAMQNPLLADLSRLKLELQRHIRGTIKCRSGQRDMVAARIILEDQPGICRIADDRDRINVVDQRR